MGDEETIVNVVSDFTSSDFCSSIYGEFEEGCKQGVEVVLPIAMRTFSTTGDQWIAGWCSDLGCE